MAFKIRFIRKEREMPRRRVTGPGLYAQLNTTNAVVYNKGNLSLDMLKEALDPLFHKIKGETNEYRKGFSFKSEIFKQTYKFGQQHN